MLRKILLILAACLLILSFSGCRKTERQKAPPSPLPPNFGPTAPPDLIPPTSPPPKY